MFEVTPSVRCTHGSHQAQPGSSIGFCTHSIQGGYLRALPSSQKAAAPHMSQPGEKPLGGAAPSLLCQTPAQSSAPRVGEQGSAEPGPYRSCIQGNIEVCTSLSRVRECDGELQEAGQLCAGGELETLKTAAGEESS